MTAESEKETKRQIESLQGQYGTSKDDILERLMSLVCDVKPELHVNTRVE